MGLPFYLTWNFSLFSLNMLSSLYIQWLIIQEEMPLLDMSVCYECLLYLDWHFFFLIWGIFWYNFIQTIFSALERNFLLCLCSWVLLSWIFYISYSYLFTVSFVLGLFDFFHFVSNSDSLSPPWSILFVSLSIEIFLWLIVTFISNSSWLFLFSFYVFNSSSI